MGVVFDDVTYLDEIKDATFSIDDGKITGIIGATDSFKGTMLDLMSGLISPFDESVIFDGIEESDIGVLYEDSFEQFFYNEIINDFNFILKRHHVKNVKKKMFDSLKMLGLSSSFLYRSPDSLSLSERKKISLALILSFNPKVILLNEPFMGLDGKDKESIIKIINMMKIRYGKTIVIASKDTDVIFRLSDKVILVNKGRVVKEGDKYDILTDTYLLKKCNLKVPKLIEFSNLVSEKGVNIGYRDDINDLAKDIYRYLR